MTRAPHPRPQGTMFRLTMRRQMKDRLQLETERSQPTNQQKTGERFQRFDIGPNATGNVFQKRHRAARARRCAAQLRLHHYPPVSRVLYRDVGLILRIQS
jgi:Mg-chelatase subunit ChlI